MAETHKTEQLGYSFLVEHLKAKGRKVEDSDRKSYDLRVDGQYAELKTKRYPYNKFDFFYITQNQKHGLDSGELATIFLVCNTDDPSNMQVFEIPREDLNNIAPKQESKYYYDKGLLNGHIERWRYT